MQMRKPALVAKSRVVVKKPLVGRALERQIIARTFAELKKKGVSTKELNGLVELRKNAIKLSKQGINLARKKKPNIEVQKKAANAWQEFYKQLSKY